MEKRGMNIHSKKQKTILIIEDETSVKKILRDVLQKENFLVIEAPNGKKGVDIAREMHPDLILLDVLMPVMDGMTALKEIRKDAWGSRVPVIILTNLSATKEEIVEDMIEGKPMYYLIKSDWKIFDVVKKIKEILKF